MEPELIKPVFATLKKLTEMTIRKKKFEAVFLDNKRTLPKETSKH